MNSVSRFQLFNYLRFIFLFEFISPLNELTSIFLILLNFKGRNLKFELFTFTMDLNSL